MPRASTVPLGALRLLADDRSTALVLPTGEVPWWCAPEVDSPPLLWSLLDGEGATARWVGVEQHTEAGEAAGCAIRVTVRCGIGRVELEDALVALQPTGTSLVRLARALDGPLDLEHELSAGGFDAPRVTFAKDGEHEAHGRCGDRAVIVSASNEVTFDDPEGSTVLRARARAPQGEWVAIVVSAGEGSPSAPPPDPEALHARIREIDRRQRHRARRARLPRSHPERAADALAVLQACTYAPTGAVIAAPTTSLPEAPGHDRQFDYRYTWLRDSSLSVSVAALLGHVEMSNAYLGFVARQLGAADGDIGPMTDVRGAPVPEEREIDGVAGWWGSTPIRVGNGARDQVQHDALGFFCEAIAVYLQQGGRLRQDVWRALRSVADSVAAADHVPTSGIWELREPALLVSEDIGRWLALDRALWIARLRRPWTKRRHWKRAREEVRARVVGAIREDGCIPQRYDEPDGPVDAAALLAVVFGLVDRRSEQAERIVDSTRDRLRVGWFLRRYDTTTDDGFSGTEGAFVPASWWLVSALAAIRRPDEAAALADAMCARLPRLFPEEIDPLTGQPLGNLPLVWAHIECARALYLLDAAETRGRWGTVGLSVWRLWRAIDLRVRRAT